VASGDHGAICTHMSARGRTGPYRLVGRESALVIGVGYAGFLRARSARAKVNRLCATVEHQQ